MHPSDWTTLGWLTLQNWDDSYSLSNRHVMGAMRLEKPDDPEDIISGNLTEGHILGGLYWDAEDREGVDCWWLTPPAVMFFQEGDPPSTDGEAKSPTTGTTGPTTGTPAEGGRPVTGGGVTYGASTSTGDQASTTPGNNTTRTRPQTPGEGGHQTSTGLNPGDPGYSGSVIEDAASGFGGGSGGWFPLARRDEPDERLAQKSFTLPSWCGKMKFPSGWQGTVAVGTLSLERSPQEEILIPGFYGLVAPNRNPDYEMGTLVHELGADRAPAFHSRLQSLMAVEQVGSEDTNALALQLGGDGQKGTAGYLLMSNQQTGVMCFAAKGGGGPITTGPAGDQHAVGMSRDGKPINAAHLRTVTLFQGDGWDAPIHFEQSPWPSPDIGPHKIMVHLVNDTSSSHAWGKGAGVGLGRWYADAFMYGGDDEDDPPPEEPPPPHDGDEGIGTTRPRTGTQPRPRTGTDPDSGGGRRGPTTGGGTTFGGGSSTGDPIHMGPRGPEGEPTGPSQGATDASNSGGSTDGGDDGTIGSPFTPGDISDALDREADAEEDTTGPDDNPHPRRGDSGGFNRDPGGVQGPMFGPPNGITAGSFPGGGARGVPIPIGSPREGRATYAQATNCIVAGGGIAFRGLARNVGEQDLTGAKVVSRQLRAMSGRAPHVAALTAHAAGDGTWDGFAYRADSVSDPSARNAGNGSILVTPSWADPAAVARGVAAGVVAGGDPTALGLVAAGFTLPTGYAAVMFGTPNSAGAVDRGCHMYAADNEEGGLAISMIDGSGSAAGSSYSFTPTGLQVHDGDLFVSGKATIDGRLDPSTLEPSDRNGGGNPIPNGASQGFTFDSTLDVLRPRWKDPAGLESSVALLSDVGGGSGAGLHEVTDANVASIVDASVLAHYLSAGVPTAGAFGLNLEMRGEDSANTQIDYCRMIARVEDTTPGLASARHDLSCRSLGVMSSWMVHDGPTSQTICQGTDLALRTGGFVASLFTDSLGVKTATTGRVLANTAGAIGLGVEHAFSVVGTVANTEVRTGSLQNVWRVLGTDADVILTHLVGGAEVRALTVDTLWRQHDQADPTKIGSHDYSLLTTATTRAYQWPDKDGTVALLSDVAGGGPLTTKGDLFGYDTGSARIPVGTDGQVLEAASGAALGVQWVTPATPPGSGLTTKGDLLGYTTAPARFPIGADDFVLTADSTNAHGYAWKAAAGGGSGDHIIDSGVDNGGVYEAVRWGRTNSNIVNGMLDGGGISLAYQLQDVNDAALVTGHHTHTIVAGGQVPGPNITTDLRWSVLTAGQVEKDLLSLDGNANAVRALAAFNVELTTALTNTLAGARRTYHRTTGVPAAGFGATDQTSLHNSSNVDTSATEITSKWDDAATPIAQLEFGFRIGGGIQKAGAFRFSSGHYLDLVGRAQLADVGGAPVAARRLAVEDGLIRAQTSVNAEGRYISKASLEQLDAADITGAFALAPTLAAGNLMGGTALQASPAGTIDLNAESGGLAFQVAANGDVRVADSAVPAQDRFKVTAAGGWEFRNAANTRTLWSDDATILALDVGTFFCPALTAWQAPTFTIKDNEGVGRISIAAAAAGGIHTLSDHLAQTRAQINSDGWNLFTGASALAATLLGSNGSRLNSINGFQINTGPQLLAGAGSPEAVVAAPVGSAYQRSDGGSGTTQYTKSSGVGNVGWEALAAAGPASGGPPNTNDYLAFTSTLAGNLVLSDASATVLFLDPGGATRRVQVPALTNLTPYFVILNTGTEFDLICQTAGGAPFATLEPGTGLRFWTDGTAVARSAKFEHQDAASVASFENYVFGANWGGANSPQANGEPAAGAVPLDYRAEHTISASSGGSFEKMSWSLGGGSGLNTVIRVYKNGAFDSDMPAMATRLGVLDMGSLVVAQGDQVGLGKTSGSDPINSTFVCHLDSGFLNTTVARWGGNPAAGHYFYSGSYHSTALNGDANPDRITIVNHSGEFKTFTWSTQLAAAGTTYSILINGAVDQVVVLGAGKVNQGSQAVTASQVLWGDELLLRFDSGTLPIAGTYGLSYTGARGASHTWRGDAQGNSGRYWQAWGFLSNGLSGSPTDQSVRCSLAGVFRNFTRQAQHFWASAETYLLKNGALTAELRVDGPTGTLTPTYVAEADEIELRSADSSSSGQTEWTFPLELI